MPDPNVLVDDMADRFGVSAVAVGDQRQGADIAAAAMARVPRKAAELEGFAFGFLGTKMIGLWSLEVQWDRQGGGLTRIAGKVLAAMLKCDFHFGSAFLAYNLRSIRRCRQRLFYHRRRITALILIVVGDTLLFRAMRS